IRKSLNEMLVVAERQAKLESLNECIEHTVRERTAELTRENLERRQAEENLRESQSQLAQAQQIAHLGSWEWNMIEDKVTWSEETRRLYGFEPDELGLSMEKCIARLHPEDAARVQQAMAEAVRTCQSFDCDHRIIIPDGTERFLHGRGEVVVNEQGQPVKMIG